MCLSAKEISAHLRRNRLYEEARAHIVEQYARGAARKAYQRHAAAHAPPAAKCVISPIAGSENHHSVAMSGNKAFYKRLTSRKRKTVIEAATFCERAADSAKRIEVAKATISHAKAWQIFGERALVSGVSGWCGIDKRADERPAAILLLPCVCWPVQRRYHQPMFGAIGGGGVKIYHQRNGSQAYNHVAAKCRRRITATYIKFFIVRSWRGAALMAHLSGSIIGRRLVLPHHCRSREYSILGNQARA